MALQDAIENRVHTMRVEQIEEELVTSVDLGLTSTGHKERLDACGANSIPEQQSATVLELLWGQINSMVIYILIVGSALSFAFNHLIDGIVIIGVVVFNVLLGYFMERKAMNATDALKNMMSTQAQVVRDGQKITVDTAELVPGDIILLQPGDIIPADARVARQSNLEVVEAALTGESHATAKDTRPCRDRNVGLADRKCMVFSGTQVIKGTATCIVTATGPECEIGKISGMLVDVKPAKTPLLEHLERFSLILSLIIIACAFGTFGIALGRGYNLADSLNIAIGVAVAAIPEGLPSCITVTFAIGVKYMAKHNAIVKSLPAVETLGSVSVICSDKTGTLTMNKMVVQKIARLHAPMVDTSEALSAQTAQQALTCLLPGILCNDSTLTVGADITYSPGAAADPHSVSDEAGEVDGGETKDIEMVPLGDSKQEQLDSAEYEVEGDPTERCILELAVTLLGGPQAAKRLLSANPRIAEIPFDSDTKYMATLHDLSADLAVLLSLTTTGDRRVILLKGAPERVLTFCYANGSNTILHPEEVAWLAQADALAEQGMRVLALAYRVVGADYELGPSLLSASAVAPQEAFTMSCLVGILDPPRPEAIAAVRVAQAAGITVKMITGDHPVTAQAVGRMLGLQSSAGTQAITGPELDQAMIRAMAEFDSVVLHNDVFARTTPKHKLRIVESLRRQGFVCSMTGDGVNDAPALKAANIGVAMGITGTQVAKDAAHMIITDDNFASIVEAVRMGRCTYANLIKIIAFVLPTNGGQAFSIIVALIIGIAVPITALQILWANMVTSVTLGIVLAFDKPENSVLDDPPRHPEKPVFGKLLSWRVFSVTVMLVLVVLGIYRWELQRGLSQDYLRTCSTNGLVAAQVAYIFCCRNVRRPVEFMGLVGGNYVLYLGILACAVFQVLFTYAPPFQYVFETAAIDGESWGKIILLAVGVLVGVRLDKTLNEWRKRWLARRRESLALERLQRRVSFTRRVSITTLTGADAV